MTRLSQSFPADRAALVTFVTAGDPTPADTGAILDALVEGGADIIELGMPFTDPMADGPSIQEADIRSLAAGTKTADIFNMAKEFRQRHPDTPLVLMGYANPMIRRGPEWFADALEQAGVDGVICVDLAPEEDADLGPALRAKGIAPIRLSTPTTDDARLPQVLHGSAGFLYYVSVAGITGKQSAAIDSIEANVSRIKQHTDLPVAVGFGVREPDQAGAIARVADGVVVGSAFIDLVAKHGSDAPAHLRDLTARLAKAVHFARKADA